MLTSVPTSLTEGPIYTAVGRSGSVCQSAEWGEPNLQQPAARVHSVERKRYWKCKSYRPNALPFQSSNVSKWKKYIASSVFMGFL